jgi:hypothetical protein
MRMKYPWGWGWGSCTSLNQEPLFEEEFRSQNSGVRIKTLDDSLTLRYQSGIQTAQELFALASLKEKTTKLKIWWGCKNADYLSASRKENIAEF